MSDTGQASCPRFGVKAQPGCSAQRSLESPYGGGVLGTFSGGLLSSFPNFVLAFPVGYGTSPGQVPRAALSKGPSKVVFPDNTWEDTDTQALVLVYHQRMESASRVPQTL